MASRQGISNNINAWIYNIAYRDEIIIFLKDSKYNSMQPMTYAFYYIK